MNLAHMMETIRKHPDFHKAGMVLAHNGVVRATSRDGREVTGLRVKVDRAGLDRLVAAQKKRPGIVEILVEIASDRDLVVGDDVMFLVVAGDVRENVITTLQETLNAIKTTVTHKTEYFAEQPAK
ncbi:MAG: molybdenum cofactor biosynthesis protein MoaE [Desulfobacterales bacterium]|nr:molybdenum cofactor biosynthesis protein MoaE [Desulfobacterales bacterium]